MLLIVCLVGLALLAGRLLPTERFVESLRLWATSRGSTGMVEFGLAYVVLALLFVPGAILTMVAGGMYGVGWGLVVVAIATSVADAAGFLLGRYVARDTVVRLMDRYPRFKVVDRTIVEGGWRIVALVRLNPTIPYSVSNYLFGVTGVPLGPLWCRAASSHCQGRSPMSIWALSAPRRSVAEAVVQSAGPSWPWALRQRWPPSCMSPC